MIVGYFSPMPPAATGVADYSAELLPHLQAIGPVSVNQPGDVNVYHIGNNALHREIYHRALAEPGVVVLHDAVLQHFFLGTDEVRYVDEFVFNYGEWSRGQAQELWAQRARSGADARYFAYPMLRRVLENARAVVVHNPAAAEIARKHTPDARIFEIPHLFVPPQLPDAVETLQFRQALGIAPRTLLVGAFGHQRETKRLGVLLRSIERATQQGASLKLLVSGEFVSATFAKTMEPLLQQPNILRTGHLEDDVFWKYLAATDLCVNLRYPSAAESSGIAIRMMGIGKAVAFTNDASISRFPENACLRVDIGPAEEDMLTEYLTWLAREREAAQAIGRNAARYIAKEHAPSKVAEQYWAAIRSVSKA